jgi:hypothetical protein
VKINSFSSTHTREFIFDECCKDSTGNKIQVWTTYYLKT